jgi:hypothetical protein
MKSITFIKKGLNTDDNANIVINFINDKTHEEAALFLLNELKQWNAVALSTLKSIVIE